MNVYLHKTFKYDVVVINYQGTVCYNTNTIRSHVNNIVGTGIVTDLGVSL